MPHRGISLSPSPFEATVIFIAHTGIDATVAAPGGALRDAWA
jgi:hypothetical protein